MTSELTPELEKELQLKARKSRGDIVAMTFLAQSGHPGGSLSSIDIYTYLYNTLDLGQDTVVVSHGHTSPGVYSALARTGLFPPQDVVKGFRRVGSPFEGHVEPGVPGVPWGTGNLGQGLSVACGYAVASRVKNTPGKVFVVMGDGEQQKGQIAEARRFIRKYGLSSITVIIDDNGLQISGSRHEVMPQDLPREYAEAGFTVLEVDGHDFKALHRAVTRASQDEGAPYAIIAHTVMGKGVSFMENKADYHGRPLNRGEMDKACPSSTWSGPSRRSPPCGRSPSHRALPGHPGLSPGSRKPPRSFMRRTCSRTTAPPWAPPSSTRPRAAGASPSRCSTATWRAP